MEKKDVNKAMTVQKVTDVRNKLKFHIKVLSTGTTDQILLSQKFNDKLQKINERIDELASQDETPNPSLDQMRETKYALKSIYMDV